jgi:hypothetical protein
MKQKIVLFFLLLLFVSSFVQAEPYQPDFHFKDLEGKKYTSLSLRGLPVIISVGSTL